MKLRTSYIDVSSCCFRILKFYRVTITSLQDFHLFYLYSQKTLYSKYLKNDILRDVYFFRKISSKRDPISTEI